MLLAGLAAAWLLLACAPALAHANLVEASPPREGEVSRPPSGSSSGSASPWTRSSTRWSCVPLAVPSRHSRCPRGSRGREGRAGGPREVVQGILHR